MLLANCLRAAGRRRACSKVGLESNNRVVMVSVLRFEDVLRRCVSLPYLAACCNNLNIASYNNIIYNSSEFKSRRELSLYSVLL